MPKSATRIEKMTSIGTPSLFVVLAQDIAQIRDQQGSAQHERRHHQNGIQRLDLWQKNVDQQERAADGRSNAVKFVEVLLFVLGAPSGAGAIVQVPDAAVQKQYAQCSVQPIPVRKIQIHGDPFPAVNPHYGSSFRKRQDKEGLPQWQCRR